MFMCHIKAAPHKSNEKAMGIPSAIAPSIEPKNIVIIMTVPYLVLVLLMC
jgi:hypothetical protein